jgi:hypothetical protein
MNAKEGEETNAPARVFKFSVINSAAFFYSEGLFAAVADGRGQSSKKKGTWDTRERIELTRTQVSRSGRGAEGEVLITVVIPTWVVVVRRGGVRWVSGTTTCVIRRRWHVRLHRRIRLQRRRWKRTRRWWERACVRQRITAALRWWRIVCISGRCVAAGLLLWRRWLRVAAVGLLWRHCTVGVCLA